MRRHLFIQTIEHAAGSRRALRSPRQFSAREVDDSELEGTEGIGSGRLPPHPAAQSAGGRGGRESSRKIRKAKGSLEEEAFERKAGSNIFLNNLNVRRSLKREKGHSHFEW